MSAGKLASQAGHAFLNSFLEAYKNNPNILALYQDCGLGTKVVLNAPCLDSLMFIHQQAQDLKLPCSLIIDSGHIMLPDFDGSPVVTALGIGPCTKKQLNGILKRFKLV